MTLTAAQVIAEFQATPRAYHTGAALPKPVHQASAAPPSQNMSFHSGAITDGIASYKTAGSVAIASVVISYFFQSTARYVGDTISRYSTKLDLKTLTIGRIVLSAAIAISSTIRAAAIDAPIPACIPISKHVTAINPHGSLRQLSASQRANVRFFLVHDHALVGSLPKTIYLLTFPSLEYARHSASTIIFPRTDCSIDCVGSAVLHTRAGRKLMHFRYRKYFLAIAVYEQRADMTQGEGREAYFAFMGDGPGTLIAIYDVWPHDGQGQRVRGKNADAIYSDADVETTGEGQGWMGATYFDCLNPGDSGPRIYRPER